MLSLCLSCSFFVSHALSLSLMHLVAIQEKKILYEFDDMELGGQDPPETGAYTNKSPAGLQIETKPESCLCHGPPSREALSGSITRYTMIILHLCQVFFKFCIFLVLALSCFPLHSLVLRWALFVSHALSLSFMLSLSLSYSFCLSCSLFVPHALSLSLMLSVFPNFFLFPHLFDISIHITYHETY